MAGMIDDFIMLLKRQAEDFSDLASLSAEKKDAIINNDIEHLQKITDLENTLVGRNQKTERRRMELLNDIAMVLNEKADTMTLSRLSELMENQPGHAELVEAAGELRNAAEKLKALNEQNRQLIEHSLEYVDFSMNLVRSMSQPAYYTSNGNEMSGGNPFFDAKQ